MANPAAAAALLIPSLALTPAQLLLVRQRAASADATRFTALMDRHIGKVTIALLKYEQAKPSEVEDARTELVDKLGEAISLAQASESLSAVVAVQQYLPRNQQGGEVVPLYQVAQLNQLTQHAHTLLSVADAAQQLSVDLTGQDRQDFATVMSRFDCSNWALVRVVVAALVCGSANQRTVLERFKFQPPEGEARAASSFRRAKIFTAVATGTAFVANFIVLRTLHAADVQGTTLPLVEIGFSTFLQFITVRNVIFVLKKLGATRLQRYSGSCS